jgi:hypothetical protein
MLISTFIAKVGFRRNHEGKETHCEGIHEDRSGFLAGRRVASKSAKCENAVSDDGLT